MIPRYQRITYWLLVAGTLFLTLMLLRGCVRNHSRIIAMRDQSPIPAPTNLPQDTASIFTANDTDGIITLESISLPLPEDPAQRVHLLLDRQLADMALPTSTHPLPAGPALLDVFLVPLPLNASNGPSNSTTSVGLSGSFATPDPPHSPYGLNHTGGAQLAVVNLTKAFADQHPSGIEAEDLTLRAILATLHANLPACEEVRFLVDGQPRPTLAGHADLTRPYALPNNGADPTKSNPRPLPRRQPPLTPCPTPLPSPFSIPVSAASPSSAPSSPSTPAPTSITSAIPPVSLTAPNPSRPSPATPSLPLHSSCRRAPRPSS